MAVSSNFLTTLPTQFEGAAKNIIKGAGLGLLKPKFFSLNVDKIAIENTSYERIDEVGYDRNSALFGTPVWDTVSLIALPYTTDDGEVIRTANTLVLDIALIEISNPRNIVETRIAGRTGTVKEYMSNADYNINIKGSLTREYANLPPEQLLNDLRVIIEHPESLSVNSNFLAYFNVNYIVIKDAVIKQRQGARNIVDYELRCSSDNPIVLDA